MENGLAILKDNMLVNVGEAYIVVNLLPEGAEEQGRSYDTLKLKMFGGPMNIKQFRNTPSNTTYILQTPPILGKFINCCFIIIVLSCHVQSCSVMFSL